jgi:hypothetical protein
VSLPRSWNPIKLEGDYAKGSAIFADMDRQRLALRWDTPRGKRFDAQRWLQQALRNEVGSLASAQAKPADASLLYVDPEPPGRDVFVSHSGISNRIIEILHHAHKRSRMFEGEILASLDDTAPGALMRWSIFDLECTSPVGYLLKAHRLNAGDLSLTFEHKRDWLTLRQIALASLALLRKPLERWIADQLQAIQRHYVAGNLVETAGGFERIATRRSRFGWMRWLPRQVLTLALHDVSRDRIVLAQGTSEELVREMVATVTLDA